MDRRLRFGGGGDEEEKNPEAFAAASEEGNKSFSSSCSRFERECGGSDCDAVNDAEEDEGANAATPTAAGCCCWCCVDGNKKDDDKDVVGGRCCCCSGCKAIENDDALRCVVGVRLRNAGVLRLSAASSRGMGGPATSHGDIIFALEREVVDAPRDGGPTPTSTTARLAGNDGSGCAGWAVDTDGGTTTLNN